MTSRAFDVLNDRDWEASSAEGILLGYVGGPVARRHVGAVGDPDDEGASSARCAEQGEATVVRFHDLPGDGQPDPGAWLTAGLALGRAPVRC